MVLGKLRCIIETLDRLTSKELILLHQIAVAGMPDETETTIMDALIGMEMVGGNNEKGNYTPTDQGELVLHLANALQPVAVHQAALNLRSAFGATKVALAELAALMGDDTQPLNATATKFETVLEKLLDCVTKTGWLVTAQEEK